MPSTADDVCADLRSAALRFADDLRCGFDRDSVMQEILRQNDAFCNNFEPCEKAGQLGGGYQGHGMALVGCGECFGEGAIRPQSQSGSVGDGEEGELSERA